MNLPRLAIHNSQFTITLVVLMVLVGIVSYLNMPRSEDPQFDIPITLLEVIYPGASPTDIETLVVDPLEEEFADIENIKKIESQVKNGGARIEVTFLYGAKWLELDANTSIGISFVFFLITALISFFGIIYHFRKPQLETVS